MSADTLLLIIFALLVKHCLADFTFQTKFMLENKGFYGHRGGLYHAAVHGALTLVALALCPVPVEWVIGLAIAETIVHYHIDWFKEAVVRHFGWRIDEDNFWNAIGIDQLAHQCTYLSMIYALIHFA